MCKQANSCYFKKAGLKAQAYKAQGSRFKPWALNLNLFYGSSKNFLKISLIEGYVFSIGTLISFVFTHFTSVISSTVCGINVWADEQVI